MKETYFCREISENLDALQSFGAKLKDDLVIHEAGVRHFVSYIGLILNFTLINYYNCFHLILKVNLKNLKSKIFF
jgi:hypothetical protein